MSVHPHQVTLTIEHNCRSLTRLVERSLSQEIGEIDDDRSTTCLDRDDRQLTLTIEATDLVALRAAVNTWLSLIEVAERVAETVDF